LEGEGAQFRKKSPRSEEPLEISQKSYPFKLLGAGLKRGRLRDLLDSESNMKPGGGYSAP